MELIRPIIRYLGYLYLLLCIVQSLFSFTSQYLSFEEILFLPALIHCFTVFKERGKLVADIWKLLVFVFSSFLLLEVINQGELIVHHLLYLARWLKYAVVFTLTYDLVKQFSKKQFKLFSQGLFLLVALFNVLIITNIAGIGENLQYVFTPKSNYIINNFYEPGIMRLSGTMNNPNDNGVVLLVFMLVFACLRNFKNFTLALLAFLLLLLTQSRTALLMCILVTLFGYSFVVKSHKLSLRKVLLGAAFLLILLIGLNLLNFSYLNDLLTGEAFSSHSFLSRVDNFFSLFKDNYLSILLGEGVILDQTEEFGFYLDSEYSMVIAQFGLVGLLVWLSLIVLLIRIGIKNFQEKNMLWVALICIYLGIGVTNLSFLHTQLGVLLFFTLGIASIEGEKIVDTRSDK